MKTNTVAIAAADTLDEFEGTHPFHALFDLVAIHGWECGLFELAEVACVRGDVAMATVLNTLVEGLLSGNVAADKLPADKKGAENGVIPTLFPEARSPRTGTINAPFWHRDGTNA